MSQERIHFRLIVCPIAHSQYCPEKGFPEWIVEPSRLPATITARVRGGPFVVWDRFLQAVAKGEVA